MTLDFDPSAFLEAERRQRETLAGALAGTLADKCDDFSPEEGQGFRRFRADRDRGLATLATLAAPPRAGSEIEDHLRAMTDLAWERLTWAAVETWNRWGVPALGLGWSVTDMFGCCPDIEARRVDMDGVVISAWRLHGPMKIEDVSDGHWTLVGPRQERMRYYRAARRGQVPMWRAYAPGMPP
jgi:hypothetical protein